MLLRIEISAAADANWGDGKRFRLAVTQDVLEAVARQASTHQIDVQRVQIVKAKKSGEKS